MKKTHPFREMNQNLIRGSGGWGGGSFSLKKTFRILILYLEYENIFTIEIINPSQSSWLMVICRISDIGPTILGVYVCAYVCAYMKILHVSKGCMVLKWSRNTVIVFDISVLFCLALKEVAAVEGSKLLRAELVGTNSRAVIEVGWVLFGGSELKVTENGQ